jgi:short-subunit dehydrogenase|tara:strand:- start:950 stop:1741 length:792 start_codon:yes stop_codon:yes gene_type:complete
MENKLKDKVVLVTGASKGIGKAIVEALSIYDLKLGLLARSEDALEKVAEYTRNAGSEVKTLRVDLNNQVEIEGAVEKLRQEYGAPDILINNAGFGARDYWTNVSLEEELKMTKVNYEAPVILIRCILPDMMKLGRGHIININTLGGVYAAPYQGAYCASKAALFAYSSSLAYELENTNVDITSLIVGPTDTGFLNRPNYEGYKKDNVMTSPEKVADKVISIINHPQEISMVESPLKLLVAKITNLHPRFFRRIIERKNTPPES